MESGSVKKRYLLRLDVFDENLNLVPAEGYETFEFRYRWQAVWFRTDLVIDGFKPTSGIWMIYDRKTGVELL